MPLTIQDVGLLITLALALLGLAFQLGFSAARLRRNEKEISEFKIESAQSEKEGRKEIKEGFDKVYRKLDELPCHNPGWRKDECR